MHHDFHPMPGDKYLETTVIASVVSDDDEEPSNIYTVLLLNPSIPYYSVAQLRVDSKGKITSLDEETFQNIVDAVKWYDS